MSLALAVARRALLVAIVAVLVAIAALVASLLGGSDGDPPESADTSQAQAEVASARAEAREAAAMAQAAAARAEEAAAAVLAAVTSVEESAFIAREAATLAQEAAGAAFEASVKADMAAANVAAAEEPPAEATDDTGAAAADDASADDSATDDTSAPETTVEDAAEDAAAVEDESEPAPADDPEDGPEDGSEPAADEPVAALPGEPYEFGPPAGAALAVVGVSHDSVLNVRDVPAGEVVARLDNVMNVAGEPVVYVRRPGSDELIATLDLNRGVIATGNTRKLPTTIWHEIRMGDAVGWASSAFLSPLGATSDSTAEIVAILGGTPTAPTLAELARVVAEAVASDEPAPRIVVSGAPVAGDLDEITVDVLDLPDDAVRGFRLHIFAHQDSDSDPFTLKTVESTTICDSHRGVSEEGLCN